MLVELDKKDFARVRPVFEVFDRVALHAVLCGATSGRVFVDDAAHPRAAFTWSEFRYSFVGGDPRNEVFCEGLRELLETQLFPEARASFDPSVVLYPASPEWIPSLEALLDEQKRIPLRRGLFRFDRAAFEQGAGRQAPVPEGFHLARIDTALLACSPEIAFGARVLWGSVENFLARGFGFYLLEGEQIASTCFSAFVAEGRAEISVDTAEAYRRRGLGTVVCGAFVGECLARGLEPTWECWWDNAPSRLLAARLGFEWVEDYPVVYVPLL
jgi:RimJ/RimL family protein N-acetyltransferase